MLPPGLSLGIMVIAAGPSQRPDIPVYQCTTKDIPVSVDNPYVAEHWQHKFQSRRHGSDPAPDQAATSVGPGAAARLIMTGPGGSATSRACREADRESALAARGQLH